MASIIESFQVHYELQQSKAQTKIEADIEELNEIFRFVNGTISMYILSM